MKRSFFTIAYLLLLTGLVSSCGGGDKKRPARKTLPALSDDVSWEGGYGRNLSQDYAADASGGSGKFYFSCRDTVVSGQSFVSLSMPDPAGDSLAWVMVNSYKPFAGGAFLLMQQQGKKGVVVNFRNSGEEPRRVSYTAKDLLGNSLSLIFLWDKESGIRASGFINELQNLPAVKCTVAGQ